MVEDGEEKKRISSFNGYLSHSSSRVEFELGLGLRLTKRTSGSKHGARSPIQSVRDEPNQFDMQSL